MKLEWGYGQSQEASDSSSQEESSNQHPNLSTRISADWFPVDKDLGG